jgi:phosphate:Na+ symporter
VTPRQIANAHTLFNVGLALLFLPITGPVARLVQRLLPDRAEPEPEDRFKPRFLDRGMLQTPALALNLAKVEILHLGERVRDMATLVLVPFLQRDLAALDRLSDMEDRVDALDEQITAYLIDIGKQDIDEEGAEDVYLMMHVTKQFEHIADIIDKELRPLARRRIADGVEFSDSGRQEVEAYHLKVLKQISRGIDAFREGSLDKAKRMTMKQVKYVALEGAYRQAHFERVHQAVSESLASSEVHLDLMDGMRKINSYSANIARAMLAQQSAQGEGKA